ncbi:391_t:CDS:2, partial [Paraglomus brasilianum]
KRKTIDYTSVLDSDIEPSGNRKRNSPSRSGENSRASMESGEVKSPTSQKKQSNSCSTPNRAAKELAPEFLFPQADNNKKKKNLSLSRKNRFSNTNSTDSSDTKANKASVSEAKSTDDEVILAGTNSNDIFEDSELSDLPIANEEDDKLNEKRVARNLKDKSSKDNIEIENLDEEGSYDEDDDESDYEESNTRRSKRKTAVSKNSTNKEPAEHKSTNSNKKTSKNVNDNNTAEKSRERSSTKKFKSLLNVLPLEDSDKVTVNHKTTSNSRISIDNILQETPTMRIGLSRKMKVKPLHPYLPR